MANKDIDTRIVEMQFDAKDFDKNIRRSSKNLEDFKKELNFENAVKQMGSVIDQSSPMNKSLGDMAKNVSKLAKEFTGIGSISTFIAQKVKNAWQGAANSVERFVKSMTSDQIKEGADKYNMLLNSVQTIMNATGESQAEVYRVMKELNDYTDETSYNFADMAQNIGKFTTAGVKLSDAEEAMEGIANWAALSGQNAQKASQAMYNISQAMSADAMLKIDWKSIQNAGMDTRQFREEAIKAAVAVGTLVKKGDLFFTKKGHKQVNLDNFTETLQFKWFDKETMMSVFKTFANSSEGIGEAAYKAAQRCTTFNDALGAWKDMLSTGWMKTYEIIFGELSNAMNLFSGMCSKVSDQLAKFVKLRNGILTHWSLGGGRNSLWGALVGELKTPDGDTLFKGAYGILDAFEEISNLFYDAFYNFVGRFIPDVQKEFYKNNPAYMFAVIGAGLRKFTVSVQEFVSKIQDFFNGTTDVVKGTRAELLRGIIEGIYSAIVLVVQVLSGIGQFGSELAVQLRPAFDTILALVNYISLLFTGKVEKGVKKNVIGNFFHSLAEMLRPLTAIINIVVMSFGKLIVTVLNFVEQSGLLNALRQTFAWIQQKVFNALVSFAKSGIFEQIIDWIQNAGAKLPDLIAKIKAIGIAIRNFVNNSKTLSKLKSVFNTKFDFKNLFNGNFRDIMKNIAQFASDVWAGLIEGLTADWKTYGDKFLQPFRNIWQKVKDFFGIHSPSVLAADVGRNVMEGFANGVVNGEASIIGRVKDVFTRIWDTIKTTVLNGFNQIRDTLPDFSKFFEGTDFMGLLTGAKDLMKWLAIFRTGSGLVNFGKGLGNIGKGIKVFGKNLRKLNFKNMFSFKNMFNNKETSFDFGNLGPQLLEIAGAIGILTLVAKELITMKPEELQTAGITIGAMLIGLVAASAATKKFGGNGLGLLGAAAAIWALAKAMGAILAPLNALMAMPLMGENGEIGGLVKGLGAIFALLLSFGIATGLAGGEQKILGTAATILALSYALKSVIEPMKILMTIPLMGENGDFGGLAQGLTAVFAILTAFGVAAGLAGSGEHMLGAAVTLLVLVKALKAVIEPIKILMNMPLMGKSGEFGGLAQGLTAMLGILLSLSAAAALAGSGASVKGMLNIAALVGAVLLLTGPIQTLAAISWDRLLPAVLSVMGVLGSLAVVAKIVGGVKPGSIMAVALMVGAVWALAQVGIDIATKLDLTQAAVGFGSIVVILGALTAAIAFSGKLKPEQLNGIKNIFVAFAVMIGIIAGSLVALKLLDVGLDTVLPFIIGLIAIVGTMAALVKQSSRLNEKGIGKVALVLGLMGVVIGAVAGSLVWMSNSNVDWKMVTAFTVGLTALIVGLGWALPKLGKLTPKEAVVGILALAASVVAIMGAISIMIPVVMGSVGSAMEQLGARLKTMSGLLKDFFDRMNTIDDRSMAHAISVFDNLKDLILSFVGFSAYSADIYGVLNQLSDLGTGLDLFFVGSNRLPDPEDAIQFKILNKFVEIGPSLAAFNIGTVPEQILYLGVGLGLFAEATKGITTDKPLALSLMQGIFGQADNIATFASLPLEKFSSQMSTLGGAMSLYAAGAKEVTGIEVDKDAPDIMQAIGILKSVAGTLAGEDSQGKFEIPEGMPSTDDIGLFAAQLAALGIAMSSFSEGAKGMDSAGVQKAMDAITLLAVMGGYLTPENLGVTKVFETEGVHGTEDGKGGTLGQFAIDIGALGTALSQFSSLTANATFDNGLGALDHFQELSQKLTKDNLAFARVFVDAGVHATALKVFSNDIGALGRALASFAENTLMEDGTKADFDHALSALNFLSVMSARLSTIKIGTSLHTLIHGEGYTLGTMSDDMQLIGQALQDFGISLNGAGESGKSFDKNTINDALGSIMKMIEICNTLNLMKPDGSGLLTWGDYMYELSNMMYAWTNANIGKEYGSSGTLADQIAQFAHSISVAFADAGDINTDSVEAFKNIAEGIRALQTVDPSMNFEYPGQMIALGIATGIRNGESDVVQAAVDVVNAAIIAAKNTAVIKSPSHVFAEMGEYMDLGLAQGLYGGQGKVEDASSDMVGSAIEQAGLIMGAVSAALAEATDLQPKITPVLDLSNVTAAGTTLNRLFDGYALNLNGALNLATAATSGSAPASVVVQNPTDLSGIQSAITTLQTEIGNLQNAISNMKIVLNNGVVAGGITDDIDLNLGRKSLYASRRN